LSKHAFVYIRLSSTSPTDAALVEPLVALHEGGEASETAHRLVRDVLAHGVAPGDPLLLRLHDHRVVVGRLSTAAREGRPVAAAPTASCTNRK